MADGDPSEGSREISLGNDRGCEDAWTLCAGDPQGQVAEWAKLHTWDSKIPSNGSHRLRENARFARFDELTAGFERPVLSESKDSGRTEGLVNGAVEIWLRTLRRA